MNRVKLKRHISKPYESQIQDWRWRQFADALIADHPNCEWCGAEEDERCHQPHHKRYIQGRMAWEYEPEDMVVLCAECHTRLHVLVDECWVKLLSLNLTELETVLKALTTMKEGSSTPVDFLRELT